MSRPSYFFGGSSASPNKNLLINGNFDVWQRGVSQTAQGYGSVDRWNFLMSGSTNSISRQSFAAGQTDVPNNPTYFCRNIVVGGALATEYVFQRQKIEDVTRTSGQTLSYSFWAKADSTKDISITSQQIFGAGGSTTVNVSVKKFTLTSNWVKYTGTVTMPSVFGKTIGVGSYFAMNYWLSAGSDYNTTTNSLGNQSGTFDIAQVQAEFGGEVTDFEHRTYGEELALCQRYYEESYFAHAGSAPVDIGSSSTFKIEKRVTPSITQKNPSGVYTGAIISWFVSSTGYGFYTNSSSANTFFRLTVCADAEL